jgi:hypothetical protein
MKHLAGLIAALVLAACETPGAPPTEAAFMPPAPGAPAMQEVLDGYALLVIL